MFPLDSLGISAAAVRKKRHDLFALLRLDLDGSQERAKM
jgi:hypothetical protein